MGEEVKDFAAINAYEGGFMVSLNERTVIVTSLNKAIKLVRDHLGGAAEEKSE